MTELLYVRIDLSVPGASMTHVAELLPLNDSQCEVVRMIELNAHDAVTGAGTATNSIVMQVPVSDVVPHPDLYGNYPDIDARIIQKQDFDALWSEAVRSFPELQD